MINISIILNIIGSLLIVFSLIYIKKYIKKEEDIYLEINTLYDDIRYYYDSIENFNDIVNDSLNEIKEIQSENLKNNYVEINKLKNTDIVKNNLDIKTKKPNKENSETDIHIKIYELKKLGVSNKEIAKKLNKGVREVEIITRMINN